MRRLFVIVVLLCAALLSAWAYRAPSEEERVKLWHEAGNTWPPSWHEESDELKALHAQREREIMAIPGANERWENWLQFTQSRLVPKFTPVGFKVVKTPAHIHERLAKAVTDGVAEWDTLRSEGKIDVIYHPDDKEPKFVDLDGLNWDVISDLKELHEEWGGMSLRQTSAYGVRLYQNGSSLVMHVDRISTHVISSIVHIGHEVRSPWSVVHRTLHATMLVEIGIYIGVAFHPFNPIPPHPSHSPPPS